MDLFYFSLDLLTPAAPYTHYTKLVSNTIAKQKELKRLFGRNAIYIGILHGSDIEIQEPEMCEISGAYEEANLAILDKEDIVKICTINEAEKIYQNLGFIFVEHNEPNQYLVMEK